MYQEFTDIQLVQLMKSGSHNALSEIYNRYWGMLYAHCLKMLRDEAEAQDVVQDIFISLWSKADMLNLKENLSGYLYITARHKVLNVIRKRKNQDRFMDLFSTFITENDAPVLAQITEKELALAIETEIHHLPEKMKVIFEYSRKDYLSHREIADILGISDKTVKKQVANAIKILRLKLSTSWILAFFIGSMLHK